MVAKNAKGRYYYRSMFENFDKEKYGADKIALLALLILAMFIAHLVTRSRSAIILSSPIILPPAGLKVAMPHGNGWQTQNQWTYKQQAFKLTSYFAPSIASPTAEASCRYIMTATDADAEQLIRQKAAEFGLVIKNTTQTSAGSNLLNFAHLEAPQSPAEIFVGFINLPNNRLVEIQVYSRLGETDQARQTLMQIAQSVQIEDPAVKIVEEIKKAGLASFLDEDTQQTHFIITDERKKTIGFSTETKTIGPRYTNFNIQVHSNVYLTGQYAQQQKSFFRTNDSLEQYIWKIEIETPAGQTTTEIALDKGGLLNVKTLGEQFTQKQYNLSPAALPEIFSDPVFAQMINSHIDSVIIDMVTSTASITPTLVSKVKTLTTATAANAGFVFTVQYLDASGFSEVVYLDSQKQVVKRILKQKRTFTMQRTSADELVINFPEKTDLILHSEDKKK